MTYDCVFVCTYACIFNFINGFVFRNCLYETILKKNTKGSKIKCGGSCVVLSSSTETIGSVLLPFSHSGAASGSAASGSPDTIGSEPRKAMDAMDPNVKPPESTSEFAERRYIMLYH